MKIGRLWHLLPGFCLALVLALPAGSARAAASDWVVTDQARLRLISGTDGVTGQSSLKIGLEIKLAPGWKFYWRSPGDAGIPPQFDWSGSKNLKTARISWPRPQIFESFGYATWGYHDEVVFPITIEPVSPDRPVDLKLHLSYGICEQVCIPYQEDLTLHLPRGNGAPTAEAELIDKFEKQVPRPAGSAGTDIKTISAVAGGPRLFSVTAKSDIAFMQPGLIVEGEPGLYFSVGKPRISPDGKEVSFGVMAELPDQSFRLKGQKITVTLLDGPRAAEGRLAIE